MTKRWTPTDEDIRNAPQWASNGLTQAQIAENFGIRPETLSRKKGEYQQLAEAIRRGKFQGIVHVTHQLRSQIDKGNVGAIAFFLKSRVGWIDSAQELLERERNQLEQKLRQEILDDFKAKLRFDTDKYLSSQIDSVFNILKRELDPELYKDICQVLSQSTVDD